VNNPTLSVFCGARLGRADIEGSKSDVAMNAWPPQASYPCGNYSDTSGMICSYFPYFRKGSLAFLSESRFVLKIVNQAGLYACVLRESSVPTEPALGHLRCRVTDMPPQPNSPSGRCLETRLATNSPEGKTLGAVLATVGSSRCLELPLDADNSKPLPCRESGVTTG
jgi:hypothetical protein